MRSALIGFGLLALVGCAEPAAIVQESSVDPSADWTLVNSESRLSFVSIKADDLAETHTFKSMTGTVSADGTASVDIALTSVDTAILIRDERMQSMLFETDTYPTANVTTKLSIDQFAALEVGDRTRLYVPMQVYLHGQTLDFEADLFITRIAPARVIVETATPILTHADDFDLGDGVEALREVANLPSISPAVPVTVSLVFEQ